ncbi:MULTISPECIES: glutathione S-transferase family protein [Symbiopectobacterium]|uniref:glutathione S-transferase family protein n=1 Tax=Symbiopectobacterium TaxID=801 RepID=UPI001A2A74FE|nr:MULTISPECIES: glutathione S-transferase family protein [Symbiopectobacterium]MBG6247386.1 glutathione S-transferase family protein [Candidatus Symbiopectobacterium sp. PLON1]MBT9429556.1 glutathione S-transferase family protein [Candidatus Symbiopectobacterium endolongispinus]
MLVIWGRKTSSNVQALMWCVGELGLQFVKHDVGHRYGGTDTAALNPNRTVPVLQDGDNPPLWETGAILRYLANRYATVGFWPEDLLARTEVERWAEWAKLNIALGFTAPVFWRVVRTPEAERDLRAIDTAVNAFEQKLDIAEQQLARHPFLAGDAFSLADIQFGHVLYRYYDIGINRKPLPHLRAYYAKIMQRPAFQEHVMVSYDELRA